MLHVAQIIEENTVIRVEKNRIERNKIFVFHENQSFFHIAAAIIWTNCNFDLFSRSLCTADPDGSNI